MDRADITAYNLNQLRADLTAIEAVRDRLHQHGYPRSLIAAECGALGVDPTAARRSAANAAEQITAAYAYLERALGALTTAANTTSSLLDRATEAAHA